MDIGIYVDRNTVFPCGTGARRWAWYVDEGLWYKGVKSFRSTFSRRYSWDIFPLADALSHALFTIRRVYYRDPSTLTIYSDPETFHDLVMGISEVYRPNDYAYFYKDIAKIAWVKSILEGSGNVSLALSAQSTLYKKAEETCLERTASSVSNENVGCGAIHLHDVSKDSNGRIIISTGSAYISHKSDNNISWSWFVSPTSYDYGNVQARESSLGEIIAIYKALQAVASSPFRSDKFVIWTHSAKALDAIKDRTKASDEVGRVARKITDLLGSLDITFKWVESASHHDMCLYSRELTAYTKHLASEVHPLLPVECLEARRDGKSMLMDLPWEGTDYSPYIEESDPRFPDNLFSPLAATATPTEEGFLVQSGGKDK